MVAYWACAQVVMRSHPGRHKVFIASCYFIFYKELLYRRCMFFENLLPYITLGPYIKRRECRSHFTSSYVRHVGITKPRKSLIRVTSNCTTSVPDFIKIRPAVLVLNHADGQTDGQPYMNSLTKFEGYEEVLFKLNKCFVKLHCHMDAIILVK
jgi:hypothetical protein